MDNISNNIDDVRGQLNYEYSTDTTKRIIKVIGVGGGGGNAVSTMYKKEMIKGVSFYSVILTSRRLTIAQSLIKSRLVQV